MKTPFLWSCPFCNRDTTITNANCLQNEFGFNRANADGPRYFRHILITCPNPKCGRVACILEMYEYKSTGGGTSWYSGDLLRSWSLIPQSTAKVYPDYVPKPIRDDYVEACLIRDLSPKASATLSRRCLQGMIRGFFGVSKGRLAEEIEAIEDKVDPLTWQAIDAVRRVGNIGAHMEKDINVIVDVEPDEAAKLIYLIELLIDDWYKARHDREERLKGVVEIKNAKDVAKAAGKPGSA